MQTQRMDLRTRGGGRVSWDEVREWHGHIYTTICKIASQWEAAAQHREVSSVLCVHLEGWDRESGRETQEGGDMGIYVYVQLIHFVIKQKLTHIVKQLYSIKMLKKKPSIWLPSGQWNEGGQEQRQGDRCCHPAQSQKQGGDPGDRKGQPEIMDMKPAAPANGKRRTSRFEAGLCQ